MALTDEEWARIVVDRQRTPEQAGALRNAAQALVDGMETCHQCKGTVLVDEQPVHCEDCSSDCDNHEGAECPTIYGLHLQLKTLLAERTPATAPAPQSTEDVVELARKIVNRLVTDAIGLQWTRNIADALIAARKKQP